MKHRRIRPGRYAALAVATASLLLIAGCSADDGPGAPGGPDGIGSDLPATAGPGTGTGPDDSGGTSLVWNECPIDAADAPEVIQLIADVTGYEVIAEPPCRFTDGARLVTFQVSGNNDEFLDARQPLVDRGFRITDLDRGQNGFLAIGELDAQARGSFGDLTLTVDMSSLDTDQAGYERLARGLIDIAIR